MYRGYFLKKLVCEECGKDTANWACVVTNIDDKITVYYCCPECNARAIEVYELKKRIWQKPNKDSDVDTVEKLHFIFSPDGEVAEC